MIYAGYVKVTLGKPQTGWEKLKISLASGEAKFSLGQGKKFTGSVTEGYIKVLYSIQKVSIECKMLLAILNLCKHCYITKLLMIFGMLIKQTKFVGNEF